MLTYQPLEMLKETLMCSFFVRLSVAALIAAACTNAVANGKIIIIAAGIEKQIYLPARLAVQLGYFKEQGLDVDLLSESAGVNAQDMMLTGAAQGVIGAYDHTLLLQAKGKFAKSVVQFTQSPGEVELVSSQLATQVTSPADFKKKRLGVTGLGSSTAFLTQYLAWLHGLKPNELTLVPVGSGRRFVKALQQRHIDAGMTTEPTASGLLASGEAYLLTDLRTPESTQKVLGGLYPFACLYMKTAWINTHRVEVQKLSNALVKALAFINTHTATDIANQLPPEDWAGNKALYVQSLEASKTMFTTDGVMPVAGPATVLKVLSAINRTMTRKTIDLAQTFTTEFAKAAK
jgi:NitT/TauT family transport system substrate-binding protein